MTDQWDEWRQEAAGIIVETAGVDEVASKAAPKAEPVETAEYVEIPPEVEAEERALIVSTAQAPQQHVVTGMATLAAMSDEEFMRAIAVMKKGQERVKQLQQSLMTKGEDYGVVKGIDRPFLHLPGAEKLINFYGLAARQEADRIVGERTLLVTAAGEQIVTQEWKSPPLAYHVRTYIHVGSFDGPVVAMGYGEASSWEVKYRYMWAKTKCPACGREDMIKGKPDGKLKGKWWCPGAKGGCNATFEAADPRIEKPGKVENTDPWSLAETLLQMAAKRSFVAASRRATGTSGLFTQDEDSPSVQQQAEPETGGDERPEVENVTGQQTVQRGGRPDAPTPQQMAQLSALSKEKKLGPDGIAAIIIRLFNVPVVMDETWTRGEKGKWLWGYIEEGFTADQLGSLLSTIDTGEVPSSAAEATAPTKATN